MIRQKNIFNVQIMVCYCQCQSSILYDFRLLLIFILKRAALLPQSSWDVYATSYSYYRSDIFRGTRIIIGET